MSIKEFKTPIMPQVESFRGYITELDKTLEVKGSIMIPFLAFARSCGANVDQVIDKQKLNVYMDLTAQEYKAKIVVHETFDDEDYPEICSGCDHPEDWCICNEEAY